MKFCKNLQRVVDISDPEWAPYWTNYKMLKKLIKELPSLVPTDDASHNTTAVIPSDAVVRAAAATLQATRKGEYGSSGESTESPAVGASTMAAGGAGGGEGFSKSSSSSGGGQLLVSPSSPSISANPTTPGSRVPPPPATARVGDGGMSAKEAMRRSPGEVAFFKLLHAELKKAEHFFERAQEEFSIREERVREGMAIMKRPNSIMLINDRWTVLAKSLYRLYKDLLLLETFAIMTYCSFSKILKKHDKVTGHDTRKAFMSNVVNQANFTNYPRVLEMIQRCEALYDEVSDLLVSEGKQSLYEDERLFISMIHRLNEQAMNTAEAEGAPDVVERKEKRIPRPEESPGGGGDAKGEASSVAKKKSSSSAHTTSVVQVHHHHHSDPVSGAASLRSVMEDTERKVAAVPQQEPSEDDDSSKKRSCPLAETIDEAERAMNAKRSRV